MLTEKAKPINNIAGRGSGIASFRRNTRAAVRGLWSGALSKSQALQSYRLAIEQGIERAWIEGAAECDIAAGELTVEELTARDEFILAQSKQASSFINNIAAQSKAQKGQLTPLLQRNEMWVNQYISASQLAESMACANEKREWVIGRTEHCRTCLRLNGQVRRLNVWQANVMPRNAVNEKLECRGFRCQCTLRRTQKPTSRGPLPRVP